MAHPNEERLGAFLRAYGDNDAGQIGEALTDDAVWHVGGTHRLSGDYRGRDAILGYFDEVGTETGRSLKLEPIEVLANDDRGAAFLRVSAERGDSHLDVTMAEAFRFDAEGRIQEFWAHATDQDAIDRFWGEGS